MVSVTSSIFRKCFRARLDSASTADISSFEYFISTTQVPSFGNVIFPYLRSEEELPTRAASCLPSALLGAGPDARVRRVAPAPGLVTPAVLPAVTLRPRRYSSPSLSSCSQIIKRHFLRCPSSKEVDPIC